MVTKKKSEDAETVVLLLEATPVFYDNEDEQTKERIGFKFLVPYFKSYAEFKSQMQLFG